VAINADIFCMKEKIAPSEFKNLKGIEYFDFEEDFVEENMRCIPMIIRFKMDAAGIKLKLAEWSKFTVEERIHLAMQKCETDSEIKTYHHFLSEIIKNHTGNDATILTIDTNPEWANVSNIPTLLLEKLTACNQPISVLQWKNLSNLQRFALIKLSKESHESKNLPKALKEFGLQGV
jgi:hypothetical protein